MPSRPGAELGSLSICAWNRRGLAATLPAGWIESQHSLQLSQTYTINLGKTEAELLESMARKHRQYIRKSERDGVRIERTMDAGSDLQSIYELYSETGQRAGFSIHSAAYYAQLWRQLGEHNHVYTASFEGRHVAFLWLATGGGTAYELYGGANDAGFQAKANYSLKWRAISDMKANGYRTYDFNGRFNEGVARFKEGFGPVETDYVGTWDYPVSKLGYHVWERLWPVATPIVRRLAGRSRTPGMP